MQTGNTDYIYKNDLDKACCNIIWLMVNIKIRLNKHNQIKFQEIKLLKLQAIQKLFDKKSKDSGIKSRSNRQIAQPINQFIRKFKKEKFILLSRPIFVVLI